MSEKMSPFYVRAFITLGLFSIVASVVFMVLGANGILTTAMACCGGSAFAYVFHHHKSPREAE